MIPDNDDRDEDAENASAGIVAVYALRVLAGILFVLIVFAECAGHAS